jgi:hypothetical protein
MEHKMLCTECGSEIRIQIIPKEKTKKNKCSLDDAMIIADICSEEVKRLNRMGKSKTRKKAHEIIVALKNVLTDLMDLPEGVSEGIITSLEKKDKTR